jgi:hypothetical protein
MTWVLIFHINSLGVPRFEKKVSNSKGAAISIKTILKLILLMRSKVIYYTNRNSTRQTSSCFSNFLFVESMEEIDTLIALAFILRQWCLFSIACTPAIWINPDML